MNLHLVQDTPFYTDHLIERINRLGCGVQLFVYINPDINKKLEYITSNNIIRLTLNDDIPKFLKDNSITKIFIHSLSNSAMKFLDHTPKQIVIYWFFWGWDGYRHPQLKKDLYLPATKEYLRNNDQYNFIRTTWLRYRSFQFEKRMNAILKKIHFCCTQIKGDFDLIKSLSDKFNMDYIFFAYRGISEQKSMISQWTPSKPLVILLGNSADPSNNHLDILLKLKPYLPDIDKIICPLSYAGNENYKRKVISEGNNLFGAKFISLTKFMPLSDYQNIIDSVDVGVFYHKRQQAYSNIMSLIEKDKRVLMNPNSTLYQMFVDLKVENVFAEFDVLLKAKSVSRNNCLYFKLEEQEIDKYYKKVFC